MSEPKHIAIILDGNRRYAKKKGLKLWQGHEFGVKKVEELLNWCNELGVKELTLYSFSMDNFKRNEIEKKILFKLFKDNIKRLERDDRLDKNRIRVRFIGRIDMFPEDLYQNIIDNSPDFVFESRLDNFQFTKVNSRACEFYGYTKREFMNMNIFDIEERPLLKEEVRRLYDNTHR